AGLTSSTLRVDAPTLRKEEKSKKLWFSFERWIFYIRDFPGQPPISSFQGTTPQDFTLCRQNYFSTRRTLMESKKAKPYPPSADVPYISALKDGVLRNAG
ncbi:MAG: hypothetical protein LBU13_02380, partial [Synergistaceae bacterium]|nr:hypothetical protein [Synergistaceae bacterium]